MPKKKTEQETIQEIHNRINELNIIIGDEELSDRDRALIEIGCCSQILITYNQQQAAAIEAEMREEENG